MNIYARICHWLRKRKLPKPARMTESEIRLLSIHLSSATHYGVMKR